MGNEEKYDTILYEPYHYDYLENSDDYDDQDEYIDYIEGRAKCNSCSKVRFLLNGRCFSCVNQKIIKCICCSRQLNETNFTFSSEEKKNVNICKHCQLFNQTISFDYLDNLNNAYDDYCGGCNHPHDVCVCDDYCYQCHRTNNICICVYDEDDYSHYDDEYYDYSHYTAYENSYYDDKYCSMCESEFCRCEM